MKKRNEMGRGGSTIEEKGRGEERVYTCVFCVICMFILVILGFIFKFKSV